MYVYIYIKLLLPLVTYQHYLSSATEGEDVSGKVRHESVPQTCCGVHADAFQLALGGSFYSGASELISGSVRVEDVLWRALEMFFWSASKGVIWFAEICEQKPNQITTIHLNLCLLTFPKLGILQHSKISGTKDKWKGLRSLKSELFKTRKFSWKHVR